MFSANLGTVPTDSKAEAAVALDKTLGLAMNKVRGIYFKRFQEYDITPQQAFALRMLREPKPMGALAEIMICDASVLTGVADRLEERGLIERQLDPNDRRVRLLALTPAGKRLREKLEKSIFAELPGSSTLSDKEITEFSRLMAKAFGVLEQ